LAVGETSYASAARLRTSETTHRGACRPLENPDAVAPKSVATTLMCNSSVKSGDATQGSVMRPINDIHHITLITGDAPRNVDFYARVMGLRLVKKTVNQDAPSVYHLYYADENGSPGANITFIEDPGAARGRAGAGMVSSIIHRVASEAALHFWSERLRDEGVELAHQPSRLAFADPEGMRHEVAIIPADDEPLIARSTEVPAEYALQGFEAVRARVADVIPSEAWLRDVLALTELTDHDWEARGVERGPHPVRADQRARGPWRRHRSPHRVVYLSRRSGRVGAARQRGGRSSDADRRPLLLRVGVLPRAGRDSVRAGNTRRRGLHRRRAIRDNGRDALPASTVRVSAREVGAQPHPAA
jgi:catechol 2,3-dioxygenase-like lactoylglutathione lyase family enzyme